MGGGGPGKLREELEAENAGVRVLADIRWLGGAKVRARFQRKGRGSSSVVAAVLGEMVFNQLCRSGVRLPGGRYEVGAFGEEQPDLLYLRCGEWGHVIPAAARIRGPSAPSVRRNTLRGTTDARLRAVR